MSIAKMIKNVGDFGCALEIATGEAVSFDCHSFGAYISFADRSELIFLTDSGDIVEI